MSGWRAYLALAGALAAVAILAAGCGGGDSAPITPVQGATGNQGQAALSKTAFITQGDAICREANAALSALNAGPAGSDAKLQATQELQITRSELQSLQSLTPPSGNGSVLDRFLSALQDQITALGNKKTAVDQGSDATSAEAEAASAASSAQAAAQAYGFKDCANAGQAPAGGVTSTSTVPTTTTPTVSVPTTPTTPPTGGTGGGAGTGGGTGTGGGAGGGSGGGTGGTGGGTGGTGG